MKRLLRLFAILFVSLLLVACGNSTEQFVITNNNNPVDGQTLEVMANPAALAQGQVLGQFAPTVVSFQVTVFDESLQQVGQQTVGRTGTAVFVGLATGDYLVRMVGLDNGGGTLGYFDQVVTVNTLVTQTQIPTLIATTTPPAPAFPTGGGTPSFLVFTSFPSATNASTRFDVTVQAFDSLGQPVTSAVTGVTLVGDTIPFEVNPPATDTNANGIVTFSNLTFAPGASGTTTLTATAAGLTSATSFPTTVSAPGNFFAAITQLTNGLAGAPDGRSSRPRLSSDGRYVAFSSRATNLVAGDTEGFTDIFWLDRQTGVIERITTGSDGDSSTAGVSDDGRFVCFDSRATNLVPNDTNNRDDVFVYDRQTQTFERVSVDSDENQGTQRSQDASMSGDGRYVTFTSESAFTAAGTSGDEQVYLRDRTAGTTILVSQGTGNVLGDDTSNDGTITRNGLFVAFRSNATNLVANDNNGRDDAFIYNVTNGTIALASTNANGDQANFGGRQVNVSEDGNIVTFTSAATNLVPGGVNQTNVYLKNLQSGAITWVSQLPGGGRADFESIAPSISGDGRFVVYISGATDIVANDTNNDDDAFLYDSVSGTNVIVSIASNGDQANGFTDPVTISADGAVVGFQSDSTNLTAAPTGGQANLFTTSNPFRQ